MRCEHIIKSAQICAKGPMGTLRCLAEAMRGKSYCPVHDGPTPIVVPKRKIKEKEQPKLWK